MKLSFDSLGIFYDYDIYAEAVREQFLNITDAALVDETEIAEIVLLIRTITSYASSSVSRQSKISQETTHKHSHIPMNRNNIIFFNDS